MRGTRTCDLKELEKRIIALERTLEALLDRIDGKAPIEDGWYWNFG